LTHFRPAAIFVLMSLVSVACNEAEKQRGIGKRPDVQPAQMMSASIPPTPHVIFISLDTLRADYVGCYGHPWVETPHIDAFARQSVLFTACMSVAPTTLASHTSLMTGTYPHTHGTPRNGFVVNDENIMLAELFREAGYHTAGFIASFVLGTRFNFQQGFDYFDETGIRMKGVADQRSEEKTAEKMTNAVLDYLDKAQPEKPLFLFVHYWDPHIPYWPPAPYSRKYMNKHQDNDKKTKMERANALSRESATAERVLGLEEPGPWSEPPDFVEQYAGEISYMDEHLGRLFRGLRDRGILDEALVVMTSDHGESLWDHEPYFTHGHDTYQVNVNVVCIVRLPGGKHGGTRVSVPISNIDLAPSALAYVGLDVPARIEGVTIDLTRPGQDMPARMLFSQATKPWEIEGDDGWPNMMKARGARLGDLTFMELPTTGQREMYDLSRDPLEQENMLEKLNSGTSDEAEEFSSKLERWASSADPLPIAYERRERSDTIKRLRALGYAR